MKQRRLLPIYFFSLLFWIFANQALATSKQVASDLRVLHQVQIDILALEASLYHYRYSLDKGALYNGLVGQVDQLQALIQKAQTLLQRYKMAPSTQNLDEYRNTYLRSVNTIMAVLRNQGVTTFAITSHYFAAHDQLLGAFNTAYRTLSTSPHAKVPHITAKARTLALLVQMMHTACNEMDAQQLRTRADKATLDNTTLRTLVARFDHTLAELPNNPSLPQLNNNWRLMKQAVLGYPEKPLPFLVAKLRNQILAQLPQ